MPTHRHPRAGSELLEELAVVSRIKRPHVAILTGSQAAVAGRWRGAFTHAADGVNIPRVLSV